MIPAAAAGQVGAKVVYANHWLGKRTCRCPRQRFILAAEPGVQFGTGGIRDGAGGVSERAEPRQERFGYVCRRCLRCCHDKKIQINPYEVARLARNRGVTTTEFRARWTVDGHGTVLSQADGGACVFLGPEGCTVHPDRPLVCRLYPLGRHVSVDGEERFTRAKTHPQSDGVFTDAGTIGDYLKEQGAGPFMQAADDYLKWLAAALSSLGSELGRAPQEVVDAPLEGNEKLLDMDAAIADHCASAGRKAPTDIEARKKLHLEILFKRLAQL